MQMLTPGLWRSREIVSVCCSGTNYHSDLSDLCGLCARLSYWIFIAPSRQERKEKLSSHSPNLASPSALLRACFASLRESRSFRSLVHRAKSAKLTKKKLVLSHL